MVDFYRLSQVLMSGTGDDDILAGVPALLNGY